VGGPVAALKDPLEAWAKEGWTDYRGRRRYDRFGDRLRKLGVGLLVHDVGKVAVPPEVLNKPARLTTRRWR
jgi:hypothetical protein